MKKSLPFAPLKKPPLKHPLQAIVAHDNHEFLRF